MRPHPYLRAYMAGIVVPTLFLLVVMVAYGIHRFYYEVSIQFVLGVPGRPLDRALVFPMAVVPNAWGIWNMLRLSIFRRARWSLGVHGLLLALILMPAGVALAGVLDDFIIQWRFAIAWVPIAMLTYYLAWKYLVGFFNDELGIA